MSELWSLLNFLDRDAFASQSAFVARHASVRTPSEIAALTADIAPYILRRLKSDVDQKLLPKEEVIVEVEMTHLQKTYYKAIFERNLDVLKSVMVDGGGGETAKKRKEAQISLRNVSMQLRKCCDHPYAWL